MNLRHALTFVTVAELGTVSRAATRLRIAQPALSRHISELENDLGLRLFDRVGRRLRLTGEGEQLLVHCRGLLNHASAVGEQAQLLRQGDQGLLKVGASSQNLESAIATFLGGYARRYPKVQVKLFDVIGPELLAMLERGDLHVAQSSIHALQPNDHRFGIMPLAPVEILAACPPGWKLGDGPNVDISRLASHPLVLQDPAFIVRRVFDAACRLAGVKPDILLESRAPHTLVAMAEAGHGIAIIPSALRTTRYKVRLYCVTYRNKPLREQLVMLWDKRRPLPRYATNFCETLAEHFRTIFPVSRPTFSGARTR